MLKRTITTIVSIAILLPILFFSDTIIFPIAVTAFALIALFEIFRCLGVVKNYWLTVPFYIIGTVAPFAVRYLRGDINYTNIAILVIIFIILYILSIIIFSNNKISYADAGSTFFSALYIILLFRESYISKI